MGILGKSTNTIIVCRCRTCTALTGTVRREDRTTAENDGEGELYDVATRRRAALPGFITRAAWLLHQVPCVPDMTLCVSVVQEEVRPRQEDAKEAEGGSGRCCCCLYCADQWLYAQLSTRQESAENRRQAAQLSGGSAGRSLSIERFIRTISSCLSPV